jgi:hypothetical protein
MSKKEFVIVSPLDEKKANLFLAMAITMNGGSMQFPREVFEAMSSMEVFFSHDENDEAVIHLEPYHEH